MITALVINGVSALMFFNVWMLKRNGPSGLIRAVKTLPATSFPERADRYVCDKCGRDVTKYFQPRQSHSWTPMGPTRFVCWCEQRYVTGAIEWDHLGPSERRRRISQTLGLGVLLSAMFSVVGILVYLVLRFLFDLREAGFFLAVFMAAGPFVLVQIEFWPKVRASVWRTRVGNSVR
jgi:hypothetical protein